jgi:hypothetical protein
MSEGSAKKLPETLKIWGIGAGEPYDPVENKADSEHEK